MRKIIYLFCCAAVLFFAFEAGFICGGHWTVKHFRALDCYIESNELHVRGDFKEDAFIGGLVVERDGSQ